jgi:hypothetical protein
MVTPSARLAHKVILLSVDAHLDSDLRYDEEIYLATAALLRDGHTLQEIEGRLREGLERALALVQSAAHDVGAEIAEEARGRRRRARRKGNVVYLPR